MERNKCDFLGPCIRTAQNKTNSCLVALSFFPSKFVFSFLLEADSREQDMSPGRLTEQESYDYVIWYGDVLFSFASEAD